MFRVSVLADDTDLDGASDAWETDNGFDPNVAGDLLTLDSDGDGVVDLIEIFQGTDKNAASAPGGLVFQSADAEAGTIVARFRRSTGDPGVKARYLWSPDLENWYVNGMDNGSFLVEIREAVIETGPGYEVVELTADVTRGTTTRLFITLEVQPVR